MKKKVPASYWDHRVMRNVSTKPMYTSYTISEVFYRRGKPWLWSDPVSPIGHNLEDLRRELKWMLAATYKPVFVPKKKKGRLGGA
mgnify:CR=1 FL=1